MSEETKFNSNIAFVFAAIAIVTVGWFAVNSGDSIDTQVATKVETPTMVVPAVATVENDKVVEEVVVTADPSNIPSDEELDNTDITNAENAE
tara:strand:+ start:972 stop:1247 length:276 start_codon:yes stop_codon:yes gene_type:complete